MDAGGVKGSLIFRFMLEQRGGEPVLLLAETGCSCSPVDLHTAEPLPTQPVGGTNDGNTLRALPVGG